MPLNDEELQRLIIAIDDRCKGHTNHDLLSELGLDPEAFVDVYLMPRVEQAAKALKISGAPGMMVLPLVLAPTVMDGLMMGAELQRIKDSGGTWLTTKMDKTDDV